MDGRANAKVDPSPDPATSEPERRLGRRVPRILPSLLLFTPYRETTLALWERHTRIDATITLEPSPIPEIDGTSYTFESLRRATNNFIRQPAVVRGLFASSRAVEKWPTPEYLPSTGLREFTLPVVTDATLGSTQMQRERMTFQAAFRDVFENRSKRYLFFPAQSRPQPGVTGQDRESSAQLQRVVDELVRSDLDVDRIRTGFGGPAHRRFVGAQLIIGYGARNPGQTTGTGWHCACSNNFFIQVAGRKRWYFISPEYSHCLFPLRNGVNSMMTGSVHMNETQQHIPTSYVDLEPGDMLYNPYWHWHRVINYDGLSVGVPLREFDLWLASRNNLLYTAVVLANNIALRAFKRDIGGYGVET